MANWKCDTCGVEVLAASRWAHLKSAGHQIRLLPSEDNSCSICKGKITLGHSARHNRSRGHIAALAIAEEQRTKEASLLTEENRQREILENTVTITETTIEEKVVDPLSPLDRFIVTDCAEYVRWITENPKYACLYRNPRSVVYTIINNLYSAIACNDPTCAWWPKSFRLPENAKAWREDILHRSIGDVALAECIIIVAKSGLTFESK